MTSGGHKISTPSSENGSSEPVEEMIPCKTPINKCIWMDMQRSLTYRYIFIVLDFNVSSIYCFRSSAYLLSAGKDEHIS